MNTTVKTHEKTPAHLLADVAPRLAAPPELVTNNHDWPDDALQVFNNAIISDRIARIGTALSRVNQTDRDWQHLLKGARLHALLNRMENHPLPRVALQMANVLHQEFINHGGHHDPVALGDYLHMRAHKFADTQIALSKDMTHWAEHGVPDVVAAEKLQQLRWQPPR